MLYTILGNKTVFEKLSQCRDSRSFPAPHVSTLVIAFLEKQELVHPRIVGLVAHTKFGLL